MTDGWLDQVMGRGFVRTSASWCDVATWDIHGAVSAIAADEICQLFGIASFQSRSDNVVASSVCIL